MSDLPDTVTPELTETAEQTEMERAEDSGSVCFSFESKTADILQSVEVVDLKNRIETRRNLQSLGVLVVLWMFIPEVMKNPAQIVSWIMIALAVGLMFVLWKYPAYSNLKYAERKVALAPRIQLEVSHDGIAVTDKEPRGTISYKDSMSVYEYKDVLAVSYLRNHLLTIPKNQLEEETLGKLRAILLKELGDNFENVLPNQKPQGFFGKRKTKD